MTLTRGRAIALLGAAAVLPQCSAKRAAGTAIRVGSKNFTEAFIVAEIYAQTLEKHGFSVERKMNLGSVQIATAALQRGDIDLYPEYTGTGLIDVLKLQPMHDPKAIFATVKREYAKRYDATWLSPSPMNDSQGLATTQTVARKYNIRTLSQLSKVAPQLRLATIAEFLGRADGLPGLQKFYGGFEFQSTKVYDAGLKYEALLQGNADVATAFTTDGQIGADNLILLKDDRNFWPPYNVAPVVRNATLRAHPTIAQLLNAASIFLTDEEARQMNYSVDHDKKDPAQVAADFLARHAA